jgi:hypothetical protein
MFSAAGLKSGKTSNIRSEMPFGKRAKARPTSNLFSLSLTISSSSLRLLQQIGAVSDAQLLDRGREGEGDRERERRE